MEMNAYTVEHIDNAKYAGHAAGKNVWKYLIKWEGYDESERSWEPEKSFLNSGGSIECFWEHADLEGQDKDDTKAFHIGQVIHLKKGCVGNGFYIVDRIVEAKCIGRLMATNIWKYKIKWKGYETERDQTWGSVTDFEDGAEHFITTFWKNADLGAEDRNDIAIFKSRQTFGLRPSGNGLNCHENNFKGSRRHKKKRLDDGDNGGMSRKRLKVASCLDPKLSDLTELTESEED